MSKVECIECSNTMDKEAMVLDDHYYCPECFDEKEERIAEKIREED